MIDNRIVGRGGRTVASFALHSNLIMAEVLYDADLVYNTVCIPEQFKNPLPQHGIVVKVGDKQDVVEPGDRVLFHPWAAHVRLASGVLHIQDKAYVIIGLVDIAACVNAKGELFPMPNEVVILPDFEAQRPDKVGLIYITGALEGVETPPDSGVVKKVGKNVTTIKPGDRVMFPLSVGAEIGLIDTVWYTIRETEIMAILPDVGS